MRKLFFLFLFLAASLAVSAQNSNVSNQGDPVSIFKPGDVYKVVHPYDVSDALDKCIRVNTTHPNPNDESPSSVYISADCRLLFYVYSNETTGMFDFIILQIKTDDGQNQF